jgi:Tfp pilus assembly protein PilF
MSQSRRQQIEELLKDDPTDAFLRYGLAMEYLSAGDEAGALARFRECLEITPDYVPAYMQTGQLLARLGEEDEARAIFQEGIRRAQAQKDAHSAQEMTGMLAALG